MTKQKDGAFIALNIFNALIEKNKCAKIDSPTKNVKRWDQSSFLL